VRRTPQAKGRFTAEIAEYAENDPQLLCAFLRPKFLPEHV